MKSSFNLLVLLLSLVSIMACDSGSQSDPASDGDSDQPTGAVAFQINWPDEHTSSSIQKRAKLDCSVNDVDSISAKVLSDASEPIESGPWQCTDGKGTIEQVPVGDNYIVTLYARDVAGNLLYHGERDYVSVQAKTQTQVDVEMSHVVSRTVSLVEKVNPGDGSSFPHRLFESKGLLYFIGLRSDSGFEIFSAEPEEDAVRLLKDIYSEDDALDRYGLMAPSGFVDSSNWIYFRANDASGVKLWHTDGTTANTAPITTSADYYNPTEIMALNNHIFFVADSPAAGNELWVYDENTGQTQMAMDILPGKEGSNPHELTVVGDALFFVANDGQHGYEIWRTDNTATSTVLAKDLHAGTIGSYPRELVDVGGRLFFIADNGPQDPEATPPTYRTEVWMIYETPDGIESRLTADLKPTDEMCGSRDFKNLTWIHDTTLAFSACVPDAGQELFLYDWQTDTAPRRITDLNPGEGSSHPANMVYMNGTIYFTAHNANNVEHLWAYAQQQLHPEPITKNLQYPSPRHLTVFNQTLYFTASNKSNQRNLWAYNGSRTGMVVGDSSETESTQHSPSNLIATADRLYYTAFSANYGVRLCQLID